MLRNAAFSALALSAQAQEPAGCFFHNVRFQPTVLDGVDQPLREVASAVQCQSACQGVVGCAIWGYFPPSQTCNLGSGKVMLQPSQSGIAGPKVCPEVPPWCVEVPSSAFPGATVADSQDAWPSGVVPMKLQCWPRNQHGQPAFCHAEETKALPGEGREAVERCDGLTQVRLAANESCNATCAANVLCPSWQEGTASTGSSEVQCWQGAGRDCFQVPGLTLLGGGRFLHGHYRVLRKLELLQVMGLTRVFASTDEQGEAGNGASHKLAVQRCNHSCLSLLACEVWQYSVAYGCWIEDPSQQSIAYPLTKQSVLSATPFAKTVVAGEYIQRLCGDRFAGSTTVAPTVLAPELPGFSGSEPSSTSPAVQGPGTLAPLATPSSTTAAMALTTVGLSSSTSPWSPPSNSSSDAVDLHPEGTFITAGQTFWWLESSGVLKHRVQNCSECGCNSGLVRVSQRDLDSIPEGSDFVCSWLPSTTAARSSERQADVQAVATTTAEPKGPSPDSAVRNLGWLATTFCMLVAMTCVSTLCYVMLRPHRSSRKAWSRSEDGSSSASEDSDLSADTVPLMSRER